LIIQKISLHDETVAFANYIQPCQLEREAHQLVVERLDMIVKRMWLPAEVRMQGSAALGLVLPEGYVLFCFCSRRFGCVYAVWCARDGLVTLSLTLSPYILSVRRDIDTVLLFRGRKSAGAKMKLLCTLEPHLKAKGIAESVEVGTAGHSGMPMLTLKTTKEYGAY
jgi:hypothetical protein